MSSAHTETPTAQPPLSPAASAHLPESTAVVARTHGEAISLFGSKLNASRFCSISGLEYGTVYTEEGQPDRLVERALACHGNKAQGTNGGCRQSGELVKLEVRIGVADAIVAYMLRTLDSCSSAAHAAYGLIPMRAVSLAFQQVIDASNITLAYRGNFWMSLAQSTTATLSDKRPTKVRLLVPPGMVSRNSSDDMTLDIDNRSKLIVTSEHIGASINGTLVCTVAGKAAVYLSDILRQNHASVPLVYSGWLAHAAVVETFKMRIVDDAENTYGVNFVAHPERDAALQHAEELSGKWASGAWNMRQNSLVYPPAMSLTKTIAKVASGINDSGYDLVHNVMELSLPYSYETINSMIENAVKVDLEFVTSDIDQFLLDTNVPGLKAARWGRTLAASLTIAINFLVAYRADGRTRITPSGVAFATAESWEDRGPGRCTGSEDCDGTAMLAASLARTIVQAPPEILAAHAHINAFKNILCPHFTIGVSVLGASGAEASGGGDASSTGQSVAGHAAALMVPALSMLNALAKGSRAIVGGSPVVPEDVRAEVAEARFNACFSPEVRASLCENERDALRNWEVASQLDTGLTSLAIEGTTPSEGHLHRTGNAKANAEKNAALDSAVFAKVGPNVGRSMKILDVGGSNPQSPHKFYHDFVEFNLGRSHPLWTDAGVRAKGYAMSQFVLCKEPDRDSGALSVAGATPRDIAVNQYSAVPHVVVNADTAALLDYASDAAGLQVMARSKPTTQLDAYQSDQLTKSLKSLSALENSLQNQPNVEGTNRSPQTHTYTCTRTRMLP